MDKQPKFCAAINAADGKANLIKRGESGYWPGNVMGLATAEDCDWFNHRHGVSPAEREAMVAGSMFGWHVPGAFAGDGKYDDAKPYSAEWKGRADYEADCARRPSYDTGEPRKSWDQLGDLERSSWTKPYRGVAA